MKEIKPLSIKYTQKTLPGVQALYLFGSIVCEHFTSESDIEVAFLCPAPVAPLQRWEMTQQLAIQLHREVDLIDLQQASTVMQFQVVSTGERIFAADEQYMPWWELKVYQLYLTLNDDRKPILEEIRKSGHIYGR